MHHKETLEEIGPSLCTDADMRITLHGKADLETGPSLSGVANSLVALEEFWPAEPVI